MRPGARPDAIAIDWVDRWSRNVLEYSGLVTAFRMLGIRLIAVGDQLDLTDARNDLVTHVRAAIGQEQLRIVKEKVSEARRSRRERGRWQGGATPDGLRTHVRDCPGLHEVTREGADGRKHVMRVRACDCEVTTLHRDPEREPTIAAIWALLLTSALSWQAMTEDVNARGFLRPNGLPWRWNDLYRIGQNPHYAGIMTYDRWIRDPHDGAIKRWRKLADQHLERNPERIVGPYVTEAEFWLVQSRRYGSQARLLPRGRNGSVHELFGLVACPDCGTIMGTTQAISAKLCGSGVPRKSPRKRYVYLRCLAARTTPPSCGNRQQVRADTVSRLLLAQVVEMVSMSDEAVTAALALRRSPQPTASLESERRKLLTSIEGADSARHALTKLLVSGALTQAEVEQELFAYRKDRAAAEARLREVEATLSETHAAPDFAQARNILQWLYSSWELLTVAERAEAFRMLFVRATYATTGTTNVESASVTTWGPTLVAAPNLASARTLLARDA